MRRLASQPRSVRYGIPRRMRAQHQTDNDDSSRPEIEPWHEQSKQAKQQKPVPGAEFQKEFKKLNFKLNFNLI